MLQALAHQPGDLRRQRGCECRRVDGGRDPRLEQWRRRRQRGCRCVGGGRSQGRQRQHRSQGVVGAAFRGHRRRHLGASHCMARCLDGLSIIRGSGWWRLMRERRTGLRRLRGTLQRHLQRQRRPRRGAVAADRLGQAGLHSQRIVGVGGGASRGCGGRRCNRALRGCCSTALLCPDNGSLRGRCSVALRSLGWRRRPTGQQLRQVRRAHAVDRAGLVGPRIGFAHLLTAALVGRAGTRVGRRLGLRIGLRIALRVRLGVGVGVGLGAALRCHPGLGPRRRLRQIQCRGKALVGTVRAAGGRLARRSSRVRRCRDRSQQRAHHVRTPAMGWRRPLRVSVTRIACSSSTFCSRWSFACCSASMRRSISLRTEARRSSLAVNASLARACAAWAKPTAWPCWAMAVSSRSAKAW